LIERMLTSFKAAKIVGARLGDLRLLKDTGKVAVAALISGLLTLVVRMALAGFRPFVILITCGIVFSIAYVIAILLLGLPSIEERDAIRYRLRSIWQTLWKSPAVHVPEN
jgi:hypothetical protein